MTAEQSTLPVVIVSNNGLVRFAVRSILASLDISSQIEVAEAPAAVRTIGKMGTSIAIVDMQAPFRDGAQAFVQSILELPATPKVIALRAETGSEGLPRSVDDETAAAPNHGVLHAEASPSHLARAVLALLGSGSLSAQVHIARLTPRQREVLSLVAAGQSNTEIARRLHIASGTVKRHLNDTFVELHARSRLDAVNRARCLDLL